MFAAWAREKLETASRRDAGSGAAAEGRTPLIFIEIPGTATGTVLMYGHLDKQPEMVGWAEGTGPWTAGDEGRQAVWPRRRR